MILIKLVHLSAIKELKPLIIAKVIMTKTSSKRMNSIRLCPFSFFAKFLSILCRVDIGIFFTIIGIKVIV